MELSVFKWNDNKFMAVLRTSPKDLKKRAGARSSIIQKILLNKTYRLYAIIGITAVFLLLIFAIPRSLQGWVNDEAAPATTIVQKPLHGFFGIGNAIGRFTGALAENKRLREENAKLEEWYYLAQLLKAENEALNRLLNVKLESNYAFLSARLLIKSGGPLDKKYTINVGYKDGVQRHQPVLGDAGLLGRIIHVEEDSAQILVLNDLNSRLPVYIGQRRHRAILTGNGSESLSLNHLPENVILNKGDTIYTSGDGIIFPAGLPVGVIHSKMNGRYRVKALSELDNHLYVRLLKVKDDQIDIQEITKQKEAESRQ